MRRVIGVGLLALAVLLSLPVGQAAAQKVTPVTTLISTTGTGESIELDTEFYNSVSFTVTMTSTGTVDFYVSGNGSTYAALSCLSSDDTSGTFVTGVTASGVYQCNVAATQKVKVTVTANAGTITVEAQASSAVARLKGGGGGGGGGAPTTAGYWVDQSNGGLSAERNLGGLTTGLVLNTVTAGVGVPSAYIGTSCTNQVLRLLNASGLGTCVTITSAYVDSSIITSGGALGTPSSGTLTNATGLPISTGVSGLGTGVATFLATPSSANLASALTGKTGLGAAVFGTAPTIDAAVLTTSVLLPNGAAPTTDAFGEIAGDNDAWAASRGSLQIFDGTANTYAVNVLASDVPANGECPKWNTGGTITWETCASGGAVATDTIWDAAGDLVVGSGANTAVRLAMGTANQVLKVNALGTGVEWGTDSTGGSPTFDSVASGTNTTATMTCGAGCSVVPSSTGVIAASSVLPAILTVNAGNSPYTVLTTDMVLLCDTTAGARTITLHAATSKHLLKIKNLGSNSCTVSRAGADTIDGGTSAVLTTQYEAIDLASDGTSAWSVF